MMELFQLSQIDKDRFWSRVDVRGENDCWPWAARKNPTGYGVIEISGDFYFAHRVAFFLLTGLDPTKRPVHHKCDNVGCCNPAHMYVGDYQFPDDDDEDDADA